MNYLFCFYIFFIKLHDRGFSRINTIHLYLFETSFPSLIKLYITDSRALTFIFKQYNESVVLFIFFTNRRIDDKNICYNLLLITRLGYLYKSYTILFERVVCAQLDCCVTDLYPKSFVQNAHLCTMWVISFTKLQVIIVSIEIYTHICIVSEVSRCLLQNSCINLRHLTFWNSLYPC